MSSANLAAHEIKLFREDNERLRRALVEIQEHGRLCCPDVLALATEALATPPPA